MNDRFTPIALGPDPRPPANFACPPPSLPFAAPRAPNTNLVDILHALPTDRLLVEARALQARMLGPQYSAHDFALMEAMVRRIERQRLDAPVRGVEPLDSMLLLDIEPSEDSCGLSFSELIGGEA